MPEVVDNKGVFSFGDFRLDPLLLTHQGSTVPLSPQAVKTLYLLVSRAPATVEKDEIMRTVWPDTFVVESGLARNISLIRKAIEERAGEGEFIETVPKRGYRFVAPLMIEPEQPPVSTAAQIAAPAASPPIAEVPVQATRQWIRWAIAAGLMILVLAVWLIRSRAIAEAPPATVQIARHLYVKGRPEEINKAIKWFETALTENPKSAIAHAGLAESLVAQYHFAGGDRKSMERAKVEAETAVRLDPAIAPSQAAIGTVLMCVDFDMPGAEKALRKALAIDPNDRSANFRYSQLLSSTGRFEESLRMATRAVELDPVSPILGVQKGLVYYSMRRFEEASREFATVLERERDFTLAHYYQGLTLGFLRRFEEAEQHLSRAELNPWVLRTDQAWLKLLQGDRKPAEQVYAATRQVVEKGDAEGSSPLLLAAWLGRLDEAFEAIDIGIRDRSGMLLSLRADPRVSIPLETDPRYKAASVRAGLEVPGVAH